MPKAATLLAVAIALGLLAAPLRAAGPTAEPLSPEERQRIEQAVPERAPAAPKRPRRLLVVSLHIRDGKPIPGHASIPHGNLALAEMGRRTGAFEAVLDNDPSAFRPDSLRQFDAVCFNNTAGVLFDDPDLRRSLLVFIAGGKGFVGLHAAAATFVQWPRYDQWPQFGQMLGAYENGGHPWKPDETITLKVDDPNHPVNAAFGGRAFQVRDEVFQFQAPYSRDKLRILLSIDTQKTDMSPSRRFLPERSRDRDFAISWVRAYGQGRVFYSCLGHNPDIFRDPTILAHFLAGIQFALGDLPAEAAPSARRHER